MGPNAVAGEEADRADRAWSSGSAGLNRQVDESRLPGIMQARSVRGLSGPTAELHLARSAIPRRPPLIRSMWACERAPITRRMPRRSRIE